MTGAWEGERTETILLGAADGDEFEVGGEEPQRGVLGQFLVERFDEPGQRVAHLVLREQLPPPGLDHVETRAAQLRNRGGAPVEAVVVGVAA